MRMIRRFALVLLLPFALPAAAQATSHDPVVLRVLDTLVLPRMAAFATAAQALADTAASDCRADSPALRAAWNAAFDAFIGVQAFRAGPAEEGGLGQAIAFWPDAKGFAERQIPALIAADDPALGDPAAFAQASVAVRGLFALEFLIYSPAVAPYGPGDPACRLVQTATADLAANAERLSGDWRGDFGAALRSAGEGGNTRFLGADEARQLLLTQLLTQLEFDKDMRLGRPLGTLDRPRPARAEARLSGRSLRSIQLSLAASEDLARALDAGQTEGVLPAFAYARGLADRLDDPVLAGVETTGGRFRAQELADAIARAAEVSGTELGAILGVAPGFNALDGD
jgi:hypothetical protein